MKYELIILKEDLSILYSNNIENKFILFAEGLLSSGKLDLAYTLSKKVKIETTEDSYFFQSDNLEKLFLDLAYFIDRSTRLFKLEEKEKNDPPKWDRTSRGSLGDSEKYFPNISKQIRKAEIKNSSNILINTNHSRELLVKKVFSF